MYFAMSSFNIHFNSKDKETLLINLIRRSSTNPSGCELLHYKLLVSDSEKYMISNPSSIRDLRQLHSPCSLPSEVHRSL